MNLQWILISYLIISNNSVISKPQDSCWNLSRFVYFHLGTEQYKYKVEWDFTWKKKRESKNRN